VKQQPTFHGEIEGGPVYGYIPVYARWANTVIYSKFFEAVEGERINIRNTGCSAVRRQDPA